MKVSLILKGNSDQLGRKPVVIRINQGEKRTYHTTEFRAAKLENLKPADQDRIRRQALKLEADLLDKKKKYHNSDFFEYVDKCMKEWDKVRAYNTMRNYKAETEKLKGFRPTFKLSDVDVDFLNSYSNYLYGLGNIATTVWTSFKFLRTIILKAYRERVIEENPFYVFKLAPYKDPPKEYLTKDEVNKIERWLPKSGPLKLCATWFVIGCYTGLRYSDMNAFNKEKNIKNGRIVLTTVKTKDIVSMPISPRLKKLFESISYQSMFISNQKFNDALKDIGKKLELPELSCHMSRHTFGVKCADAGISIEVTARLMGHRSTKATSIYYKITNPRIDREVKKLG